MFTALGIRLTHALRVCPWNAGLPDWLRDKCTTRYLAPVCTIDIKKVDKQLTHAIHVKDRHMNDTFIDKLTKWYQ